MKMHQVILDKPCYLSKKVMTKNLKMQCPYDQIKVCVKLRCYMQGFWATPCQVNSQFANL